MNKVMTIEEAVGLVSDGEIVALGREWKDLL